MSDLFVGSTIAGCRLDAVAGRGGMGVVYRATQLALHRTVALKAIAPRLAQDVAYRERFQRESHLAASLEHPNVIPVYEAGELDGTLYLIMRWVDGTDLRTLLSHEGRLDPARALRLLRPVASALAAAHRRGLIHRDVKPANVLIARGEGDEEHVYLTDFGIAKRAGGQSLTRTGVLVGTLDYTAPERIEGVKGSPASDIYAFGCMLFEALTGHVPYPRPTEIAKMHAHINEPLPSLAEELPGVPHALAGIVARAIAKRPEDRYASANDLVAAIDAALAQVEESERQATRISAAPIDEPPPVTTPEPVTPTEPPRTETTDGRPERRRVRPVVWFAALALLVLVGAIVAIASSGGGGGHPSASAPTTSAQTTSRPIATTGLPVLHGPGLQNQHPIKLTASPVGLAADGKRAWAIAPGRLVELDAGGSRPPVAIDGEPTNIAVDPASGRVWMTGVGSGGVTVFDPQSGEKTPIDTGTNPDLIAISGTAAWLARRGESSVTRVPLAGGAGGARETIPVGNPIAAIGDAFLRLWVAPLTGAVKVIDDDGTPDNLAGPQIPPATVGIAPSNGVWFLSGSLTRVDPRASAATGNIYTAHPDQATVGPDPVAIGALNGNDAIWVLTRGDRTLRRIATSGTDTNNKVTARVTFPATPTELAVGDHILWVAVPSTKFIYPITF